MSDREWAHVLLMKLKRRYGHAKREEEVLRYFEQIRFSERARTLRALHRAVDTILDEAPAPPSPKEPT